MATKTTTFLALADGAEHESIRLLIPLLANELFTHALYKNYHWHVEGEDFHQYHLLFDKHADEHIPLADILAERIRTLGGKAPGMPADVIKHTTINTPIVNGHDGQAMIRNLCEVHETALTALRKAAAAAEENKDDGTNDIVVSDVLRVHELQLWFVRSSLR